MSEVKKSLSRLQQVGSSANCEKGFSTAEWIVLMGFTIILLAGMVQGLYIENVRSTTLSTLRDSARAGARVGDLETIYNNSDPNDDNEVIQDCRDRLVNTLSQVSRADTSQATCEIGFVDVAGTDRRYFVEATVGDINNVQLLPVIGRVFEQRLDNLSARYYSSESAR